MSSEYRAGPTPSEIARATAFGNAITSLRAGAHAPGSLDVAYDKLALEERLFKRAGQTTGEQPPRQHIFIGSFRLDRRIATGGMGSVYLAWCSSAKRHVAIKVLHDFDGHRSEARILDEARCLARVNHRGVVQIYEVDDDTVWTIAAVGEEKEAPPVGRIAMIVMEYVPGRTLEEWLEGRPPWRMIVAVFVQVAHGLAAAHRQGLLHCDITPRNVLVCDVEEAEGRAAAPSAKLIDFGLSRATGDPAGGPSPQAPAGDSAPYLVVDVVCGTAGYAAPEQLERGRRIDARSDVFGLCATMWHALVTELPYDPAVLRPGTTVEARIPLTIRREAWPRRLPGWLCELLMRGLRLDLDGRPANMTQLIRTLEGRLSWRQRAVRWVVVPLASAAAAVAVAKAVAYQPLPAPFARGDPGIEQVWHVERQQRLTERMQAADPAVGDAWPELLHAIGEYTASWERMRGSIRASAPSEWTHEMKRFAGGCLLEARDEFDQVLAAIEVSVEKTDVKDWEPRIHRWLVGLSPPTRCQLPRYAVSRVASEPAADPGPWREHYARGYQHYLERDLDAAVREFDQAMAAAAADAVGRARVHFRLALVDFDRSRIDAGLAHLHDALRLTNEDGDLYIRFHALKLLVLHSPDPVTAVGHYLDALGLVARMFEGASAGLDAVGELHIAAAWAVRRVDRAGRFDRCPIDCDAVTRPRRACATAVEQGARAQLCEQDLLDLAVEASPGSRELAQAAAKTRADILLDRGDVAAAEEVALAMSRLDDPDRPRTWLPGLYETLARVHGQQGRLEEADDSLQRGLTAMRSRGEGHGAMAFYALRLRFALAAVRGDTKSARSLGEQALTVLDRLDVRALVPDALEVLARLGGIYVSEPTVRDEARGVLLLNRGLALAAGRDLDETHALIVAEIHMLLATTWLRQGKLAEADAARVAALDLGFSRDDVLFAEFERLRSQTGRQENDTKE